jgi:hypothetical protein
MKKKIQSLEVILKDYKVEEKHNIDQYMIDAKNQIIYIDAGMNSYEKLFNFCLATESIYNEWADNVNSMIGAYRAIKTTMEDKDIFNAYLNLYLDKK